MILLVVAFLISVLAGLWVYARWNFGSLEKLGIPVVEYSNPLLGSMKDIYNNAGGPLDIGWMKKYGEVFGVYEGRTPQLFICNPEITQQICLKDWQYFNARRPFEFGDPIVNNFPDFLPGEKGKLVHSLFVNAFATSKLKVMEPHIQEAAIEFVAELKENIKKENGVLKQAAIDGAVHQMSTELICRAMFNLDLKDDPVTRAEIFRVVAEAVKLDYPPKTWWYSLTLYYTHSFPFLRKLFPFDIFQGEPARAFYKIAKRLMAQRLESGEKKNDIVDTLIDWHERLSTDEFRKVGITEETLIFQTLVFMVAGQDQIATAVGGAIFHMAKDPHFKDAIRKEVDAAFEKGNGKVDHSQFTELPVVHAAIQESLRLYTVFHRLERVCTKDWSWRNDKFDLSIPKGTVLQFCVWPLNRNEKYTPEPDEFRFERFLPENRAKATVFGENFNHSHGHGPRSCVGRPFVNKVMPIVLAYLVKHFEFAAEPDAEVKTFPGGFFIQPHEPILVDITERKF